MLSIRNISSFFEISLEKLKNMTVGNVLTEYLNIKLTTFASLYKLTGREIDIVKMKKISTVPYPDDQNLYGLVIKMLEAHGKYYLSHFLVKVLPLVQLKYSISMVWLEIEINLNFFRALSNKTKCNYCSVTEKIPRIFIWQNVRSVSLDPHQYMLILFASLLPSHYMLIFTSA
jgi:hypothetical protein